MVTIKKGRCARIKDGAALSVPTVPWHWDSNVRIAIAPGISCFKANQTYEHGGVSPRSALCRGCRVEAGLRPSRSDHHQLKWRGLTLVVEFSGLPDGARIDLRSSAVTLIEHRRDGPPYGRGGKGTPTRRR